MLKVSLMKVIKFSWFWLLFFVYLPINAFSQNQDSLNEKKQNLEIKKETVNYPKIKIGGLFQGRYVTSLSKNVDTEGLHHSNETGTDNSFLIKYMRVQMRAEVSEKTEVVVLANLADFKSDPKNKVLENAFLQYTFNPKLVLRFGQFRPLFGLEETYPIDVIRTLEWSNQYNELAKLGWTSFQIGASIGGKTKIGTMPFQYAFSVVNGNGKNQVSDSDNGKLYSTRLVLGLSEKNNVNLGINAGTGESFSKKTYALGLDLTSRIYFSDRLNLDLQTEAVQGINHALYNSLAVDKRTDNINDYVIKDIYILPDFRYEIKSENKLAISAIELSCRYEYLDTNSKIASNPKQTYTPMVGLEFLKNYGGRIQLGVQINKFKNEIPDSTSYNSNLLVMQVQTRF